MIAYTVPNLIIILVVQVNCEENTITEFHVSDAIRITALVLIINLVL
jgi:hypothetical protein